MKQYSQILGRHRVQPEELMALGTVILSPSPQATSEHGSPGGHQTQRRPLQQLPEGVLRWGHINNLEETASGCPSLSPVVNIALFRETVRFQTTSYLISNHAPFQKSFQEKHRFSFWQETKLSENLYTPPRSWGTNSWLVLGQKWHQPRTLAETVHICLVFQLSWGAAVQSSGIERYVWAVWTERPAFESHLCLPQVGESTRIHCSTLCFPVGKHTWEATWEAVWRCKSNMLIS